MGIKLHKYKKKHIVSFINYSAPKIEEELDIENSITQLPPSARRNKQIKSKVLGKSAELFDEISKDTHKVRFQEKEVSSANFLNIFKVYL